MAGRKLTEEQRDEIAVMYAADEETTSEIAERFGVSSRTVSVIAQKAGLEPRRSAKKRSVNKAEELARRKMELQQELARVDEELARARVRFENHGNGQVTIYGITSMFVRNGCLARFREWLVQEYGVLSSAEELKS